MTLAQWLRKHDTVYSLRRPCDVWIVFTKNPDLYCLDDYVVSTAGGLVTWLIRRSEKA